MEGQEMYCDSLDLGLVTMDDLKNVPMYSEYFHDPGRLEAVSWSSWECYCVRTAIGSLKAMGQYPPNWKCPHKLLESSPTLITPSVPKSGFFGPAVHTHRVPLVSPEIEALKKEYQRIIVILREWVTAFPLARMDRIHLDTISSRIRDFEVTEQFNTYHRLSHERDTNPYQWPLISFARLFWMYTVSVAKPDRLSNLIMRLDTLFVMTLVGETRHKRAVYRKLNGCDMMERPHERAPGEYHALVTGVGKWCSEMTVDLTAPEMVAWFVLREVAAVLWDISTCKW